MVEWIGSAWGGWHVDLDLIPQGSTVMSAGLGNDISFDMELIRLRDARVVGVDPSQLAEETVLKECPAMGLIKRALFIDNKGVSFSWGKSNGQSIYEQSRQVRVDSISVDEILEEESDASLLKMNIEGGEYAVIMGQWKLNIPQVLIRFHHRKDFVPYDRQATELCLFKLERMGYKIAFEDSGTDTVDHEVVLTLC